MNRIVMNNILIDLKPLYGISRMRPLGRYGAIYRKGLAQEHRP